MSAVVEAWAATASAWPSQWTAGKVDTGGTATIPATGSGQLGGIASNYKTNRRYLNGIATVDAIDYSGTVTIASLVEHYIDITGHCTPETSAYYPNGYGISLYPSTANQWQLLASYGTGQYGQQTGTIAYVAGHTYGWRLAISGYTSKAKVWDITANQPEPDWMLTWTDTDSAYPSGKFSLGYQSGASGTTVPVVKFGPVTDNLASGSYTGTLALSGSGAVTPSGFPRIPGSAAISGTGSVAPSGSPRLPGSAPLTGTSALALNGVPVLTGTLNLTGASAVDPTGSPRATGTLTLAGSGAVGPSGTPLLMGSLPLTGAGDAPTSGTPHVADTVPLTGSGTLALVGDVTSSDTMPVDGSSVLTVAGAPVLSGTLTLDGVGDVASHGVPHVSGALDLAGDGSLAPSGQQAGDMTGSVPVVGVGTLTLDGAPVAEGTLPITSTADIVLTGRLTADGTLTLTGTGTLALSGHLVGDIPAVYDLTLTVPDRPYTAATTDRAWTAATTPRPWRIDVD